MAAPAGAKMVKPGPASRGFWQSDEGSPCKDRTGAGSHKAQLAADKVRATSGMGGIIVLHGLSGVVLQAVSITRKAAAISKGGQHGIQGGEPLNAAQPAPPDQACMPCRQ